MQLIRGGIVDTSISSGYPSRPPRPPPTTRPQLPYQPLSLNTTTELNGQQTKQLSNAHGHLVGNSVGALTKPGKHDVYEFPVSCNIYIVFVHRSYTVFRRRQQSRMQRHRQRIVNDCRQCQHK
jgi:hypothetical protein